jgi:hypothetical protein
VIPAAAAGGYALIRICALRDADTVRVVLRCAESGFGVEHYGAVFGCADDAAFEPQPAPAAGQVGPVELPAASDAGIVDGAELYGQTCFASGQFRRIAILPEVTSRSCRALARADDDQPWFSDVSGAQTGLVLGSPGLADATLQMLQACVPHRRLLPAGCDSVMFSGRAAEGAVQIRAMAAGAASEPDQARREAPRATVTAAGIPGQRAPQAPETTPAALIPQQAASSEQTGKASSEPAGEAGTELAGVADPGGSVLDQAWDIEAVDTTGQPLVSWRGVRMRDAGPLPRAAAWPPALLSVYLERVSAELGLGPGLRVEVVCGQPEADGAPQAMAGGHATGMGQLIGFVLCVRAAGAAACGWSAAESGPVPSQQADHALAAARAQMFSRFLGEPRSTVSARVRAIAACLSMSGAPAGCPIVVRDIADDGWVLLSAAGADMVCTVVDVSGVPGPVAVALMTGKPRWERRGSGQPARPATHRPRQAEARS